MSTDVDAGEASAPITRAVLVHGIWQSKATCFGFLRYDLEARGVEVLQPSLKPADGRGGLRPMADQLKRQIDEAFGPDERFMLVGFSMGGLVSRIYLQDLEGSPRCEAFVSISTPHHGTKMAKWHWGTGAAEMHPTSELIKALEKTEHRLNGVRLVSYRTPMDLVIIPANSSIWEKAENVSIPCPLHPLMTFSPKLRRDLCTRFSFPGNLPSKSKKRSRPMGLVSRR